MGAQESCAFEVESMREALAPRALTESVFADRAVCVLLLEVAARVVLVETLVVVGVLDAVVLKTTSTQ